MFSNKMNSQKFVQNANAQFGFHFCGKKICKSLLYNGQNAKMIWRNECKWAHLMFSSTYTKKSKKNYFPVRFPGRGRGRERRGNHLLYFRNLTFKFRTETCNLNLPSPAYFAICYLTKSLLYIWRNPLETAPGLILIPKPGASADSRFYNTKEMWKNRSYRKAKSNPGTTTTRKPQVECVVCCVQMEHARRQNPLNGQKWVGQLLIFSPFSSSG